MKNTTQTNQHRALAYEIFKKAIKYTVYLGILYFAFEGFMAWE